jgi:hypothetical protein
MNSIQNEVKNLYEMKNLPKNFSLYMKLENDNFL